MSHSQEGHIIRNQVNRADEEINSQENFYVGETVQMMPQEEIKSENDLGFMTEVDAEFKN